MLSEHLKNTFVKDFSLSFPVLDDPYFDYYINLCDNIDETRKKYEVFSELLGICGNENEMLHCISSVKKQVISTIEQNSTYMKMLDDTLGFATVQNNCKQGNIYCDANIDRLIISVDLVSANFQSLRGYSSDIVDGCRTFGEYIDQFNTHEYFKMVKSLRQVIFGSLNPKQQQKLSRYYVDQMVGFCILNGINTDNIIVCGNDEFVIMTDETHLDEDLCTIKNSAKMLRQQFRVDHFYLRKIHPKYKFFKKEFVDGSFKLKMVPNFFYPQVVKYVINKDVQEEDLVFKHEGQLSKFLKPLFLE